MQNLQPEEVGMATGMDSLKGGLGRLMGNPSMAASHGNVGGASPLRDTESLTPRARKQPRGTAPAALPCCRLSEGTGKPL